METLHVAQCRSVDGTTPDQVKVVAAHKQIRQSLNAADLRYASKVQRLNDQCRSYFFPVPRLHPSPRSCAPRSLKRIETGAILPASDRAWSSI